MASDPRQLLNRIRSELKALEDDLARAGSGPEGAGLKMEIVEHGRSILQQLEAIRAAHGRRRAGIVEQVIAEDDDDLTAFATSERVREAVPDERTAKSHPRMQKRELVASALEKLGCPSPPATVSTVIRHLFDVDVAASQFASFRKGDERAWHKGKRDKPLIVPALNAFDLSARPRTVALSTWPLENRIMGSLSDRADAFRAILAADGFWRREGKDVWRELMVIFARDFRFAPPDSKGTDKEAITISALAKQSLDQIQGQDMTDRRKAAERASRMSEEWQMFGRPVGLDVIQGGKHA